MFDTVLTKYCESLQLGLDYTFVHNPIYDKTNYIYSIYLAKEQLEDDILLMHGDLVYEEAVLQQVIASKTSCMTVSSTLPLPEKDFKAVIQRTEQGEQIRKVGIEFFDSAMAAQPLYKLWKKDWMIWMNRIIIFCERQETSCYAENAFNEVSDQCVIRPLDVKNTLCNEIDTPQDLDTIKERLM